MPPFGIKHFFVWLAFFVLLKLLSSWTVSMMDQAPVSWKYRAWGEIEMARVAAVFMGAVVLVITRKARGVFLQHPGHWLILVSCASDLVNWGGSLSYAMFGIIVDWTLTIYSIVALILYVFAAVWTRGVWRWIFVAFAMRPVAFGLARRIFSSQSVSTIGFLSPMLDVAVIVVATRDAVLKIPRDWVHWLGVTSMAVSASFPLWFWMFGTA